VTVTFDSTKGAIKRCTEPPCPICGLNVEFRYSILIMNQKSADLLQCRNCKYLFIGEPDWLGDSFGTTLHSVDVGSVDRCLIVADFVEGLIRSEKIHNEKFLDWGGGYGLLARILRDRGFDFASYDPFIEPLFVKKSVPSGVKEYKAVVVSEVLLHITEPLGFIRELFDESETIVITALVPPKNVESTWWYLMPITGQHVSFFYTQTFQKIAQLTNAFYYSDNKFFHVLSKKKLKAHSRVLIRSRILMFGFALLCYNTRVFKRAIGRSNSLTQSDSESEILNNATKPGL